MHPSPALQLINAFAMLLTVEKSVFSLLRAEIVESLHKSKKQIGGKRKVVSLVCIDETHFTRWKRNAAGFAGRETLGRDGHSYKAIAPFETHFSP